MSDLFRTEAITAKGTISDSFSDIGARSPLSWNTLTLFLTLGFAGVVIAALTIDVNTAETVRGTLRSSLGEAKIFPPRLGITTRCEFNAGDNVRAGELLAAVETHKSLSVGDEYYTLEKGNIEQQISQLEESGSTLDDNFNREIHALHSNSSHLNGLLRILDEKITIEIDALVDAENRARETQSNFEEGLTTKDQLFSKLDAVTNLELSIAQSKAERFRILSEIEANQLREIAAQKEHQREQISTVRALATANQKLLENEAESGFAVTAPIDGVIANTNCKVGELIEAPTQLFTIIPKNGSLYGEIYVPSRSIGFVKPGHDVILKYDAFPHQTYGVFKGRVVSVASAPENLEINGEHSNLFKIKIEPVLADDRRETGRVIEFRTGMEFTADIILERRKLYTWFLLE